MPSRTGDGNVAVADGRQWTYWRKAWDSDRWRVVPAQGLVIVQTGRSESNPETNRSGSIIVLRSVDDDRFSGQFDQLGLIERIEQCVVDAAEQLEEIVVSDVAGRDEQESLGRSVDEVPIEEVVILRHDDATLLVGERAISASVVLLPSAGPIV